jgi:hypothetical protein
MWLISDILGGEGVDLGTNIFNNQKLGKLGTYQISLSIQSTQKN